MTKPLKNSFLWNQKAYDFSFQDLILVAPLLSNMQLCIYALPDAALVVLCNLMNAPALNSDIVTKEYRKKL